MLFPLLYNLVVITFDSVVKTPRSHYSNVLYLAVRSLGACFFHYHKSLLTLWLIIYFRVNQYFLALKFASVLFIKNVRIRTSHRSLASSLKTCSVCS